jgi:hypothetical protein
LESQSSTGFRHKTSVPSPFTPCPPHRVTSGPPSHRPRA